MGITTVGVWGGRPALTWWWPSSKLSGGPSGLPRLTVVPSTMSTSGTRRPWTNKPLSEPLSIAAQWPLKGWV